MNVEYQHISKVSCEADVSLCSCFINRRVTSVHTLHKCAINWTLLFSRVRQMLLSKCSHVLSWKMDPSPQSQMMACNDKTKGNNNNQKQLDWQSTAGKQSKPLCFSSVNEFLITLCCSFRQKGDIQDNFATKEKNWMPTQCDFVTIVWFMIHFFKNTNIPKYLPLLIKETFKSHFAKQAPETLNLCLTNGLKRFDPA